MLMNTQPSLTAMMERRPIPGSVIVDQVVFPAVAPTLVPRPLGSATGCALLRLTNGSIWMLRAPGAIWSPERLSIASSALVDGDATKMNVRSATARLDSSLGLPVIIVDEPRLDPLDTAPWDLYGVAAALVRRTAGGARARKAQGEWASRTASVEEDLGVCLSFAISEFLSALDPIARASATGGAGFSVAVYNFLVHPAHGTYRRQFAETFPGLVPKVVNAARDSFGNELLEIIDSGRPIVRSLAARWQVRPGVVRHLIGKPIDLVGEHWTMRMPQLAIILNALIPEDMPGDQQEGWDLLNRVVGIGERLFRRPVWQTAVGLDWTRHAMHALRGGDPEIARRWLPGPAELYQIDAFRRSLETALHRELGPIERGVRAQEEIDRVVERFLLIAAPRGLESLAAQFQELQTQARLQAVEKVRRRESRNSRRAERGMNPLLPAGFRSSDGLRVIRSLTTDKALSDHGTAMNNCLGQYVHRGRYEAHCQNSDHYLLGICDASTGEPRSTAYLTVSVLGKISVIEHSGANNAEPSDTCTAALCDLLDYLETDRFRRWVRAQHMRRSGPTVFRRTPSMPDPTVPSAIRRAIGDAAYAGLVTEIQAMGQ